jgi:DNA-binding transcriptional MocR family regulator
LTFYSTLTHPLTGILLLVTDGERLTRSSYLDSAKRLALATGAAKFASTVKEDCLGGCVSNLAFVEPYLNSALSPFFKNADRRHGLVLGYGATNLQDIEEGLRRLASILQKTGSAHRSSG